MSETWLPLVGFEQFYAISDQGNVWQYPMDCVDRRGRAYKRRGGPVALRDATGQGHLNFTATGGGKFRTVSVHRAMLETFIGPPPADGQYWIASHINENAGDNWLENLEWDTQSNNIKKRHANPRNVRSHKRIGRGTETHCARGHDRATNTYTSPRGQKHCRACNLDNQKKHRRRRVEAKATPDAAA